MIGLVFIPIVAIGIAALWLGSERGQRWREWRMTRRLWAKRRREIRMSLQGRRRK